MIRSWALPGGVTSVAYRIYDALRRRINRRLVSYLQARAIQSNPSVVLEAGSGPAYASSLLGRCPGVRSVALDCDPEALSLARQRDPQLAVVLGDLTALPFKPESFDVVWNSSTLEHLTDPDRALTEMARVTMRGGALFVGVPYRWGPLGFQPLLKRTALGVWLGSVWSGTELSCRLQRVQLQPRDRLVYGWQCFVGVLARKCL